MRCLPLMVLLFELMEVFGVPLSKCRNYQDPAVTRFRKYIQIDTSKQENIYRAVEFWRVQAAELDLPFNVFTPNDLPVVVITLLGSNTSLPSIMLNSHMDVVPAVESEWTYSPFSAFMDEDGNIYGRGTQDDKDVSIQYMEVVRRLKKENIVLKRNLHITLMPDEETGGFRGMIPFIKTEAFRALNVGFILDEGLPSIDDTLLISYQDRRPWQIQVTVHGEGGHGFTMPDDSAMEKAQRFIKVVNNYRDQMKEIMKSVNPLDFGTYTSLNINIMAGGYRTNVIPSEISMVVDMRLSTGSDVTEIEQMVKSWIAEAGNGTEFAFLRRDDVSAKTTLDDNNPYWVAIRDTINEMSLDVAPVVLPATSDMLVLRNLGFPAVGFSPKLQTVSAIHSKNEYLNVDTFLKGIDIFYNILLSLGNLSPT